MSLFSIPSVERSRADGTIDLPVPRLVQLFAVALAIAACRDDAPAEVPTPAIVETTAAAIDDAPIPIEAPGASLRVLHAGQLAELDLSAVERLDLALAESDRLGRLTEIDAATACEGLDLAAVVARAPRLTQLRLSGCSSAIASLSALAPSLRELELAEIELGTSALRELAGFAQLRTLTLARVQAAEDLDVDVLRPLAIERVALVELERDSALAGALAQWPKTLQEVVLVGSWAGHDAMQRLAKAEAVTRIELRDTRIGNFSLNQIKPLTRLAELELIGGTFNDNSPLYFRDLPVTRFTCECPGFGDGGLRTLRHCESVRELALRQTRVTGAGLVALGRLPELAALELDGVDVGEAGFAALAQQPMLRRLDLAGNADDPRMPELGTLVRLEHLRLHYPELDDRAAPELATLVALRELDLAGTRISDVGLAALAGMTKLRWLSLSRTRITNRGLASLAELGALEHLDLDHTDLVDAAMSHVARLHALRELRIDHTLVTDASVESVLELRALERLDVSGTATSAEALARLATLPALTEIVRGE